MKPPHVILSRELKGLLDRTYQLGEYALSIRKFENEIAQIFKGKSVAIVGNSPGLINQGLGKEIDSHDLVIRLNGGIRVPKPEDLGRKMDVIFLGATMEKEKDFLELNKDHTSCIAISTSKNKNILSAVPISAAVYYPRILPRMITRYIQNLLNIQTVKVKFRPPRSGLICLAALQRYGQTKKISLYGMSSSLEKSKNRVTPTGEVTTYDSQQYKSLHCDPAFELALLTQLIEYDPKIDWRGRE
jgi:Glycosyltransferase family 29 (sialyltransferase)